MPDIMIIRHSFPHGQAHFKVDKPRVVHGPHLFSDAVLRAAKRMKLHRIKLGYAGELDFDTITEGRQNL